MGGTGSGRVERVGARGRREARVLPEDRALELLLRGARLEAELLVEDAPRVAVDLESVRLPSAPVEREQPLFEESLAVGMLGRERLELRDDGVVATGREVGVHAKLERGQAQLFEPLRVGGAPRLVG
ncbi:MAG TPA: hypothetical protein VKB70_08075, partial [Gaiellaceae bacterium]|nr:hypothetical protein [Gaiellaceae bacterium]